MKRLLRMCVATVVALSSVLVSMPVRAQSGLGLEISPVRSDVVVEAGKETSVTIRVTNNVASAVVARMGINDFTPNENGEVQLLDESVKGTTSVKDLVVKPADVTIQPEESTNVVVQIAVPTAQAPGTYYGVLRFDALSVADAANAAATGVSLGASLGYVLIVQVPGSLTEAMTIDGVAPERNKMQSRLLAATPEFMDITMKNSGQTLLKPFGAVQIFNFRNKEVASVSVNGGDTKTSILPGAKRVIKSTAITSKLLPGRYKAITTMAYGNSNQTIDYTMTFWVLPPLFVGGVIVALIALLMFIAYMVRKMRRKLSHHRR